MTRHKRAQIISVDLTLAIVLFMIAFASFYFLFFSEARKDIRPIAEENTLLSTALQSSPNINLIRRGEFTDATELNRLLSMKDDELKALLGLRYDFCVIFHDSQGKLKEIKIGDDCYTVSFGTKTVKFLIGGTAVPCGYTFNSLKQPC